MLVLCTVFHFFFFSDTATTEIYTLSLHDALPIFRRYTLPGKDPHRWADRSGFSRGGPNPATEDRKSTRLNSSHANISYAVFCLKKKNVTDSTNEVTAQYATHTTVKQFTHINSTQA